MAEETTSPVASMPTSPSAASCVAIGGRRVVRDEQDPAAAAWSAAIASTAPAIG